MEEAGSALSGLESGSSVGGPPAGAAEDDVVVLAEDHGLRPAPDPAVLRENLDGVYLRWVNSRLARFIDRGALDPCASVMTDLKSGVVLSYLLAELHIIGGVDGADGPASRGSGGGAGGKAPQHVKLERGTTKIQCIANLNAAFEAMDRAGVKVVNIGSSDIYDGRATCVLGLLWTLMSWSALREGAAWRTPETSRGSDLHRHLANAPLTALKLDLVGWVRTVVGENDVHVSADLCASFADGAAFEALLRAYDEPYTPNKALGGAPPPHDGTEEARADRLRAIFRHAEVALGVPPLLDADDPVCLNDEKAVMAYLCEFRHVCASRGASAMTNVMTQSRNAASKAPTIELFLEDSRDSASERSPVGSLAAKFDTRRRDRARVVDDDDDDDDDYDDPRSSALGSVLCGCAPRTYDGRASSSSPTEKKKTKKKKKKKKRGGGIFFDDDDVSLADVNAPPGAPGADEERATGRIKVFVGVHGARGLLSEGGSINPFVIAKYRNQELRTKHSECTDAPTWNQDVIFDLTLPLRLGSKVELFIFSAGTVFADTLLGKAEVPLVELLEQAGIRTAAPEGAAAAPAPPTPTCLLRRTALPVLPCDTGDQDALFHVRFSGTRSMQRINPLHDSRRLYRNADRLGTIECSVFALDTETFDRGT